MNYYFDSSALAKRYIVEIGTKWVEAIVIPSSGHEIYTSELTLTELVSAFARRQREGTITLQASQVARSLAEIHFKQTFEIIHITDSIITLANDLLQRHPLRAYDAIQLSTALIVNSQMMSVSSNPLTFVSSDQRLISIAVIEGLPTDNPNMHP